MEAGAGLDAKQRQRRVVAQILAGNLPDELRTLHPVNVESDNGQAVTIFVTGDYLAVGSSEDFVRSPLSLPSALTVSRAFGMLLPTPRMVDAIYAQADLRLREQPGRVAIYGWHRAVGDPIPDNLQPAGTRSKSGMRRPAR